MKSFYATILFSALVSAGSIYFAPTEDCNGDGIIVSTSDGGSGGCGQLEGWSSANAEQVDNGCSFTIYTDSNCNDNAATAGLGQCVYYPGLYIYSYSYDC